MEPPKVIFICLENFSASDKYKYKYKEIVETNLLGVGNDEIQSEGVGRHQEGHPVDRWPRVPPILQKIKWLSARNL